MEGNIANEVATLQRLSIGQLRQRFAEVFGEATRAGNKIWLVKRIAWRVQALAEGDLSERARHRAEELARDADLRLNPPRNMSIAPPVPEAIAAARRCFSLLHGPLSLFLAPLNFPLFRGTIHDARILTLLA